MEKTSNEGKILSKQQTKIGLHEVRTNEDVDRWIRALIKGKEKGGGRFTEWYSRVHFQVQS